MTTEGGVLVLCTGNVCRSPFAERLLASRLSSDGSIRVSSAGTRALAGRPMTATTRSLLDDRAAEASGFRARQLTPAMLLEADLILCMTREHFATAVDYAPAALARTFTIVEFARTTDVHTPGESTGARASTLRERVIEQHRVRAQVSLHDEDDIVDPFGRGDAAYAEMAAQLDPAVASVATWMRAA